MGGPILFKEYVLFIWTCSLLKKINSKWSQRCPEQTLLFVFSCFLGNAKQNDQLVSMSVFCSTIKILEHNVKIKIKTNLNFHQVLTAYLTSLRTWQDRDHQFSLNYAGITSSLCCHWWVRNTLAVSSLNQLEYTFQCLHSTAEFD